MIKLTLKSASLLLMTLFSTTGWANSPFAEEEEAAATTLNETDTMSETAEPSPFAEQELVPQALEQQTKTVETQQQGDVLAVPQATQAQPIAVQFLDFPRRGMSTDKVQNELGRPGEIIPAIGQPPILRWVYDDRVVYFEYSTVIHVVAR